MVKNGQSAPKPTASSAAGRFGTFAGVFTPNILTILGLILFLRIGWVVGQVGLWGALIIILLANFISFMTGLSLSAIATNMQVKAGGNYYLISRSLGLEIGGAIGIPLFLSQAISVAFYVIGFTETLITLDPFEGIDPRIIATAVVGVFVIIGYVGADFALKIQFGILAVLIFVLISFFVGGITAGFSSSPVLNANYTEGITFWAVFAVFFPAVTGIEVGTSLSGDLKDPSKSIPRGTIASILVTAIIYVLVAVVLAFNASPDQLINDNLAMQRLAIVPILILLGVWASTLSSALGSISPPRTLQAIANDEIVPKWMGFRLGSLTEPRAAVLITGVIAFITVWGGDLNAVAPIITMFFLNTYGMVNLVASIEKLVGNPSFRPRFSIPWYLSFMGAIGCYGAMILIHPLATVMAIIVSYGVFFYLERRELQSTWGDVRSGIWIALARFSLLNLENRAEQSRNWRPNIMVFTRQPHNRQQLVEAADWLSHGRGIVTFFQLLVGDVHAHGIRGTREKARKHIRSFIEDHGIKAFAEAEVVSDFKQGALTVVQAHGIGRLESNIVLMGWSGQRSALTSQIQMVRDFAALRKSVFLLKYNVDRGYGQRNRIDVWWGGRGGNADLMLLSDHLIQVHQSWRGSTIRILRIVGDDKAIDNTRKHMEDLLHEVRVEAEPVILTRTDRSHTIYEMIAENSADSDLTFIGMQLPDIEGLEDYCNRLDDFANTMGSIIFVRNGESDEELLTPE